MVGEEVVEQYNEIRRLREGAGGKRSLKPFDILGHDPHHMWTYFIQGPEGIKIGKSRSPRGRMADLQQAHATELELLLAVPEKQLREADAHAKFPHLRLSGEWFQPDEELLDFIEDQRAKANPKHKRPPPHIEAMISKLTCARPAAPKHKRNHISNLIEQLRNYACATDPRVRTFLEGAMARSMTQIEA